MDTQQFHVVVALAVTAIAASFDWATREIPNTICVGGILGGIGLNVWSGFAQSGWRGAVSGFGLSLLGMFLSAFIPFVVYMRGEMGGGDVKLLAAIGAIVGWMLGFQVLLYTYAFTLIAVLPVRLLVKGRMRTLTHHLRAVLVNPFRPAGAKLEVVPFRLPAQVMGPSIFIGLVICAGKYWSIL